MPERIDGGRALAALGAILLIVSLFLDWFVAAPGFRGPGITGWDAFEVLDLILTFLALIVIVHAAPALARAVRSPDAPSGLFPVVGIVAFVIVAAALLNHPPAAQGRDPTTGAWLALGGAALMAAGGILSAARISIVVNVGPRTHAPRRGERAPEHAAAEPFDAASEPFDAATESETRTLPETRRT
jgi:hypothetical protein